MLCVSVHWKPCLCCLTKGQASLLEHEGHAGEPCHPSWGHPRPAYSQLNSKHVTEPTLSASQMAADHKLMNEPGQARRNCLLTWSHN